ncbi:cyclic-amp response element binding protein [Anaeramoeba flamelloides]|uniref:Cyclic-amp response element binding protein n=1 Tax=Anaeramoeba flamelloides TaxID=1746091 RepID=A0ABQ8YPN7_9EUKA|nr:cyclic-amp response element binding protein [Anaeramoeba flamelloides]
MLDDIFSSNLDQELFDAICEPSFNLSDTLFNNSDSDNSETEFTLPKDKTQAQPSTNTKSNLLIPNTFISQESDCADSSDDDKKILWDLMKPIDFGIGSDKQKSQVLGNERKRALECDDQLQGQMHGLLEGKQLGSDLLVASRGTQNESSLRSKAASKDNADLASQTTIAPLTQGQEQDSEIQGTLLQAKCSKSDNDLKKTSSGSKVLGSGFKKRKVLIKISRPNRKALTIVSTKIVKVENRGKGNNGDGDDEAKKSSKSGKMSQKKKNKKKHQEKKNKNKKKKKKKKKNKKNKKKKKKTTHEDSRRKIILERNRINAKKSRERKKIYVANLETTTKELRERNNELSDELVILSNKNENLCKEISDLRNLLKGNLFDTKIFENLFQFNNNNDNDNNNNSNHNNNQNINEIFTNRIFETLASSILNIQNQNQNHIQNNLNPNSNHYPNPNPNKNPNPNPEPDPNKNPNKNPNPNKK